MQQPLAHELMRASAWTGKTYQLTNRYLQLLQAQQRPDQILAATFTRKAAGEILNRILLRLAEAAADSTKLKELRKALGDPSLTRERCVEMLTATTGQLHRLRVGTLDSFFAQLAGAFALELGLPPGWRITEEHRDAALRARAIEMVLDNEETRGLLTLVHALTQGETTRSLDREVRDQVNQLYTIYRESSPEAWQRVPRPNKLSDEQLAEAIDVLRSVQLPAHKTWEKTRAKDVESAEAGDWASLVGGGIAAKIMAKEEKYCGKPIEPAVAAAYATLIQQAKAVLLHQLADQTDATFQLLDKFHDQYQRLKRESRGLRFEDVTLQLAERKLDLTSGASAAERDPAPAETPSLDRLSFRLDSHLRHLLLDEFQDTSLAQWDVIRPFAEQVTRGGPDHSFFCVGDTKQAIYGWRGGVAEIFDAVAEELSGIQQRPLDVSWRSSPVATGAVRRIFGNLHQHSNLDDLAPAVAAWQKQFTDYQTAEPKQGLNGYVCLQAARAPSEEESDPQPVVTLRYAAEQVAKWREKAPQFNVGVLVRRNDAVRRLIYELRELGIEASEEGGSSLDDSAAVRLILSLVQLADHPADSVARFHLATSPLSRSLELFEAADSAEAAEAVESAEEDSSDGFSPQQILEAIRFAGRRGDVAAGRLARHVRRQLMDEGYGPTVYQWARQLAPACDRRELRRLEKLIGLAYQYEPSTRPRDFVAYIESAKVRDPLSAAVRVMTVHQAKGLEFDIVVLVELEANLVGQRNTLVVGRPSPTAPIDRVCRRRNQALQQLLPDDWQRLFRDADHQDLSESLCVLYVATTRPVHALHMIVAPSSANEKSLHKTFGGLLRAALTDGERIEPEQIAYEMGDPRWYQTPGVKVEPTAAETVEKADALPPLEVRLAPAAPRRLRGLQRVSPSGLEGGNRVRLSSHEGQSTERRAALARGTVIHACFEQIHWLDDGEVGERRLRDAVASLPELALPSEEVARLLAEFQRLLEVPRIANCLRRTAYPQWAGKRLEVENERPIAVRQEDRLLVGNIDRLVTAYDGDRPFAAEILDFKTDAVPPGDERVLREKVAYYRPQLDAYRQAVGSIFKIPPERVHARLLFVQGPEIVSL